MKTKLAILPLIAALGCTFSMLSAQDAPKPPGDSPRRPDGPPPAGGDMKARLEEFIKKMDTNGDGKVSKEEFLSQEKQQAEERFAKIDANGDGTVDKLEMEEAGRKMREARGGLSSPGAPAPGGEAKGGFRRPEGASEGGVRPRPEGENKREGNPVPAPGAEGSPRPGGFAQGGGGMGGGIGEVFRRVQEKGSVTKEEYQKISEEQFGKLDSNKDGKITKEELEESMRKMREMMGNRGGQTQGFQPRTEGGGVRPRPEGDAPKRPEGDAPKQ